MLSSIKAYEKLEKNYNEICAKAMVNVLSISKPDENDHVIAICDFDQDNMEHQFILSIARAVSSIAEAQVAVKISPLRRWWLNRKLPTECRLLPYKKKYDKYAVHPDELLEFMRPWAAKLCKEKIEEFSFGDIYYRFYA